MTINGFQASQVIMNEIIRTGGSAKCYSDGLTSVVSGIHRWMMDQTHSVHFSALWLFIQ